MANNQLYTLLYATVDGALLMEEGSVSLTRTSGSQPVTTVAKGYAGESPGAGMVELEIDNAVPSADFEFDAGSKLLSLTQVELGILGPGGKRLTAKGFIYQDSLKHSTNNPSAYSFSFRGSLSQFE